MARRRWVWARTSMVLSATPMPQPLDDLVRLDRGRPQLGIFPVSLRSFIRNNRWWTARQDLPKAAALSHLDRVERQNYEHKRVAGDPRSGNRRTDGSRLRRPK